MVSKNMHTAARYFPTTTEEMGSGEVSSSWSVLLFFSSESSRMVKSGTTNRKIRLILLSTELNCELSEAKLVSAKNRPTTNRKKPINT